MQGCSHILGRGLDYLFLILFLGKSFHKNVFQFLCRTVENKVVEQEKESLGLCFIFICYYFTHVRLIIRRRRLSNTVQVYLFLTDRIEAGN